MSGEPADTGGASRTSAIGQADADVVVFRARPRSYRSTGWTLLLVGLGLVAVLVFAVLPAPPVVAVLFGAPGAMFIVLGNGFLRRAREGPVPVLTLTREGLQDRRLGPAVLPWSEVHRAHFRTSSGDTPLSFWELELYAPTMVPLRKDWLEWTGFPGAIRLRRDRVSLLVEFLEDARWPVADAIAGLAPEVRLDTAGLGRRPPTAREGA